MNGYGPALAFAVTPGARPRTPEPASTRATITPKQQATHPDEAQRTIGAAVAPALDDESRGDARGRLPPDATGTEQGRDRPLANVDVNESNGGVGDIDRDLSRSRDRI